MSQFLFGHNVQTHNNSLSNLCRGVGERVLFTNRKLDSPIKPKNGIFELRCGKYRDKLLSAIGYRSDVTYDQFVSFYTGPRRLIYQKAVDSLMVTPVNQRDAHLKTFVKAEKINFDVKDDPAPRVIQPRDPRYNVEVGRYLRPLEHILYQEIDNLFNSPTIMSAYNAYEQAKHIRNKWDLYSEPVCIGLDASRFDQHVSVQALEFEHTLYNRVFRSKRLKTMLSWQLNNRGIARASDGFFFYEQKGSRMSGDMNTSMGNKFLMCLMARSYLDSLSVRTSFVNNGDDCLLILERKHLNHVANLKDYFRDFGFNIVAEPPVYEFEQIEFCQTKPICSNGIWRMVRSVATCLTKDVTCLNLGHDVNLYRVLLRDIGNCGASTSGDVPILGSFYRMLSRFGLDGAVKFTDEYSYYKTAARNTTCIHDKPDDYGRYSFYVSTGISPDEQLVFEEYFDTSIWGGDNRQVIEQHLKWLICKLDGRDADGRQRGGGLPRTL